MAMLLLSSFFIGCTLIILSKLKVSNIARFVPFSVMGGFLAGTGGLMVIGSITIMVGYQPSLNSLDSMLKPFELLLWLPAFAFALLVFLLNHTIKKPLIIPAVIVASVAIFFITLFVLDVPKTEAFHHLLGPYPKSGIWQLPTLALFSDVSWQAIFQQIGNIFTLLVLVLISLLLNSSGVEIQTKKMCDLERELTVTGVATASAPFWGGGLIGYNLLSGSLLNHQMSAKSRATGITSALFCAALVFFGEDILNYVPKFIVGGLIAYLGIELLYDWILKPLRKIPVLDYGIILTIFLTIIFTTFLTGIIVGLVINLIVFIVNYSRSDAIKKTTTLHSASSNVQRDFAQNKYLYKNGEKVYLIFLKDYIFYGNIHTLKTNIVRYVDIHKEDLQYLLLDFSNVLNIDYTAIVGLQQIYSHLQKNNIQLITTNAVKKQLSRLEQAFSDIDKSQTARWKNFDTMDLGLEYCESNLLAENFFPTPDANTLVEILLDQIPESALSDEHRSYIEKTFNNPLSLKKGDVLCNLDDESHDLYYLVSGELDIIVMEDDAPKRLRRILPGTFIGEMAYFLNIPRSASIIASTGCELNSISFQSLETIYKQDPILTAVLFQILGKELSAKLIARPICFP